MKEFGIIFIVVIVSLAVLMSSNASPNIFNQQNVRGATTGAQTDSYTEQNNGPSIPPEQLSPFAHYVVIRSINNAESFVNTEYVVISTRTTNVPINLTGWTLVSDITGRRVSIGNASPLLQRQPSQALIVGSNQDIVLSSGTSPIGESFRVNKCTGYLEQNNNYIPDLPKECPYINSEDVPIAVADNSICRSYVNSFYQCTIPQREYQDVPDFCEAFVRGVASYAGCVSLHQNDQGFYRNEWRVFLNSTMPLWKKRGERLLLLDSQGKIVSIFSR